MSCRELLYMCTLGRQPYKILIAITAATFTLLKNTITSLNCFSRTAQNLCRRSKIQYRWLLICINQQISIIVSFCKVVFFWLPLLLCHFIRSLSNIMWGTNASQNVTSKCSSYATFPLSTGSLMETCSQTQNSLFEWVYLFTVGCVVTQVGNNCEMTKTH